MNEISINDLLKEVASYSQESINVVKKAYDLAKDLHKGQYRQSGEEYIIHPLNVAYILAGMHADTNTICAGLLHDTLEDTTLTKEEIIKNFNKETADLVDGVTKLKKMNFASKKEENNANMRKIITSITKDVRIIIIKLADRLHNMRTLMYKTPFKQKENAIETLEIFVPLAYYIGAFRIKCELEDLSFSYLMPYYYQNIKEKKENLETKVEPFIKEMEYKLTKILNSENIPSSMRIRTKNIYGIYKKLKEGQGLNNMHDLFALKIIVDSTINCYKTLYFVHQNYHPINYKFKDYICNPKTNMYQSLHTTVFGPGENLVQAQIRTKQMDDVASFGLATYWNNNKNGAREKMQEDLKNKYQFYSSLDEINSAFLDNTRFVSEVKSEVLADKVYVYNAKGEITELPKGSTVIDYINKVNIDSINLIDNIFVNEELVDYNYILKNKDRIKVITKVGIKENVLTRK